MKRTILRSMVITVFAMTALFGANIQGTWDFDVNWAPGVHGTPVFVLQQKGAKISGTYNGLSGKANVKGSINGTAVTLQFDTKDGAMTVVGEVDNSGREIKGRILYSGVPAVFEAKRR